MRILIIGSNNAWRMEMATARALERAGHTVRVIDDRRIKRILGWRLTQKVVQYQAEQFRPQFVFLSKCLALDLETVAAIIRDRPNAMWYHDPQWYRDIDRLDVGHIAAVGRLSKTFFVTGFDAEWRALGLPAKFLPAAGDSGIRPVPTARETHPRFASDVAFIGTGYDPARAAVLLEVAKRHRVRVYGLGWDQWSDRLDWFGKPVEGADFARACSGAHITLGVNPARAEGGTTYTSDRTWMVMLAGGFYLGQGTPGVRMFLRDREHCAWYDDAQDCADQAWYYLRNPEEREWIRAAGEHFVRDNHTYDQRIHNLLSGTAWVNPVPSESGIA